MGRDGKGIRPATGPAPRPRGDEIPGAGGRGRPVFSQRTRKLAAAAGGHRSPGEPYVVGPHPLFRPRGSTHGLNPGDGEPRKGQQEISGKIISLYIVKGGARARRA